MGGRRNRRIQLGAAAVAAGLLVFAALAPAKADDSFTPGSGAASATTMVFNIPYSGANIGFGVGEANASFFEDNARAAAQTVNPGFLNLAKILKSCGVNFPIPLPTPTTADTNETGGAPDEHVKSPPSGGAGAGTETAKAYPGASGFGESSGLSFGLPGIAMIYGGTARSEAKVDAATQTRTTTPR